jgi:hypothetical protein
LSWGDEEEIHEETGFQVDEVKSAPAAAPVAAPKTKKKKEAATTDGSEIEAGEEEPAPSSISNPTFSGVEPEWQYYSDDNVPVKGLKIAIKGKSKTGKSVLAASSCLDDEEVPTAVGPSIPPGVPTYILDTENAAYWLAKYYGPQFKAHKISVMPVYMEDPKSKAIDPVASYHFFWKKFTELIELDVGTIVVDSVSDFFQWMQSTLRIEVLKVGPQITSGFNKDIKTSDWYWRNAECEKFLKMIRATKMNVILTAKVKAKYEAEMDQKSGKTKITKTDEYVPIWKEETPYWVDLVIDMDIELINNVPTRVATCEGSRAGIPLNYKIVKPNFLKIVETIKSIQPVLEW